MQRNNSNDHEKMVMYWNVFHSGRHFRKLVFENEYEIIYSKNMSLITHVLVPEPLTQGTMTAGVS